MKRLILFVSLFYISSCAIHVLRPDYEGVVWSKAGGNGSRIRFEVANTSHLKNEAVDSILGTALDQQGYASDSGLCPRECDLFVTVSDRLNYDDGLVPFSMYLSAFTLGLLPMKTVKTDVVVTYQMSDANRNVFVRTYSLSHYAVGSIMVFLFPSDENSMHGRMLAVLERVTHEFLNEYERTLVGGSLPTVYQRISLKDGREFFFVGLQEAGVESTILLNNGKKVQIPADSIATKTVMTGPVPMIGSPIW